MVRVLAVLVVVSVLIAACGEEQPRLTMHESVPDDLDALAGDVWAEFNSAFPAKQNCISDVTLVAAWELDDRAQLDPETRTISVRVPATAPQLTESLIHELGHVLEYSCPDQTPLRQRFLAAAGLPADRNWQDAPRWEDIPSEHWAETVVQYVVGSRLAHAGSIPVAPDAVDLVARWATDG